MSEYVHVVDRSGWPAGEWDNEPDKVQWNHAGFACLAVRNRMGAWCGYVGVPNGHPDYEKHYDNVDVHVHGGLTYSNKCQPEGPICHIPEPGFPDDVWWLGFDLLHGGDDSPGMMKIRTDLDPERKIEKKFEDEFGPLNRWRDVYRNLKYVTKETNHLAKQLAKRHVVHR